MNEILTILLLAPLVYLAMGWFGPRSGNCSCCGGGVCECEPTGNPVYSACDDYPISKLIKFSGLKDSSGCDNGVCVDLDATNIVVDGGDPSICELHGYTLDLSAATNCASGKAIALTATCYFNGTGDEWKWALEFTNTGNSTQTHTWLSDAIAKESSCVGAKALNGSITYNTEFDLFGTPTWPDPVACELASCTAEIIS